MSDSRAGEKTAVNWRGPLLAAAVFACVFGVLLLMARLDQSKTSDEGSSFRQDPYGSSLLFDAYEHAGYRLERSRDEDSIADQDGPRTVAFFIGGFDRGDMETRDGKVMQGGKFHGLLEKFLAHGGRVVLLQHEAGINVMSMPGLEQAAKGGKTWQKKENWGVERGYDSSGRHQLAPAWAAPKFPAMPAGSEMMYLAGDAPWLKTEAQWTTLYAGPVNARDESVDKPMADGEPPEHVYMAMRRVGIGELVVASQESFLLNEAIKTHPNPALLDFLAGGRPVIWVDETLHGLGQDQGVLWLVQRYRLQAALLLFWATLLALLWSMSGDLVRRPAPDRQAGIIHAGQSAGSAAQRLLQRSIATEQVAAECWEQFRHRSPQDAQAISADPRWGPRLRAALAQPALAGYKELASLITERRRSAKGLEQTVGEAPHRNLASPKSQEAPIA